MQDVMRSVARNAHRMEYDPKRGTFRGWLYTVTRNKIYNFLSSQRNRPRGTGDADAQERLDATPAREEEGPGRRLGEGVPAGAERPRDGARQGGVPAEHVGGVLADRGRGAWGGRGRRRLKMSPGAVYVAKSRVLARLRDEVQQMMA
jgi:RNA polymerase sigma-70 factor (ECF subfamily)